MISLIYCWPLIYLAIRSPETLRKQLKLAMKEKNQDKLAAVIEECEAAGFLELTSRLQKARDAFEELAGSIGGQHKY